MWVPLSATVALVAAAATLEWDPLPMHSPHIPQDTVACLLRDPIKCICSKERTGMLGESSDLVLAQSASRFIRISSMVAAAMVVSDRLSYGCTLNRFRFQCLKASFDAPLLLTGLATFVPHFQMHFSCCCKAQVNDQLPAVPFKLIQIGRIYTSISNTEPLRTLSIKLEPCISAVAALAESGGGPSGP